MDEESEPMCRGRGKVVENLSDKRKVRRAKLIRHGVQRLSWYSAFRTDDQQYLTNRPNYANKEQPGERSGASQ